MVAIVSAGVGDLAIKVVAVDCGEQLGEDRDLLLLPAIRRFALAGQDHQVRPFAQGLACGEGVDERDEVLLANRPGNREHDGSVGIAQERGDERSGAAACGGVVLRGSPCRTS